MADLVENSVIANPLPARYQIRRKVRLLTIEPRGIATKIAGYGYATIAYFAGTTIEAVEKAAARGVFRLDDLGSVARYITAPHKKRTPDHPPPPRRRQEPGESIRARIAGRGKTKLAVDLSVEPIGPSS